MATRRVGPLVVAVFGTVLACYPCSAQTPQNPQVDAPFAAWDNDRSPGCVVGVAQNGRFLHLRGYGRADLAKQVPNAAPMVYNIGSISKQFTSAAIALLSLQGRLSLDDDIRKHLPELPNYGTPITIRHLIHHVNGLETLDELMEEAGIRPGDHITDSVAIALIARQSELRFHPGSRHEYGNSGHYLLGQIVERVSGQSLRAFAAERLFEPLGMTHTHFHDDPAHPIEHLATGYAGSAQNGYQVADMTKATLVGAGGLYTTVEDLLKWDENFYTKQVGGEELHSLLLTRGTLNNGDTLRYAFGNYVDTYRGLRRIAHGGSHIGYNAYLLRFPDEHLSVFMTCNIGTIDRSPLAHAVAAIYLGNVMTDETDDGVAILFAMGVVVTLVSAAVTEKRVQVVQEAL